MVVKSLIGKTRNKFNVSVAEVADQDVHKTLILGFSFVSTDNRQADKACFDLFQILAAAMLNPLKDKRIDSVNVSTGGVIPVESKAFPSYQPPMLKLLKN